ncbi:MAG TPA: hypothetical protein QGG47_07345 [Acidobacteriota bacterium]|jgi:hypothetical protein|nr:hypothetical protein [Acidobacteriota bacterium]
MPLARSAQGTPRTQTRLQQWAVVLLFVVSLPAVTPRLYASDEIQYFAFLRSLWFDQDLSFDNEYRYFHDRGIARSFGFEETFLELTTSTGRRYNFGTIGCALLWAPFFGVADLSVRLMRTVGADVVADGFSRPYLRAVAYGSAFYGFLAVLLSIRVACRLTGSWRRGQLAGLIVWLGTPLLFYMYVAPGMAHACSAFAVAVFVNVWLSVRERWSARGLVALGTSAALMVMVREQDVLFVIGPALDFVWMLGTDMQSGWSHRVGERLTAVCAAVAAFGVCYLPQAAAYLILNGRLGPPDYIANKMQWFAPYAGHVLLSPGHGLLVWTPLVLLCLVGLAVLVLTAPSRSTRRVATCLGLMFAAQVYISGSIDSWTVAGSFGQRRFVGTTVILVIGMAAMLKLATAQRSRVGLSLLLGGCVWWNLGLMAQFGSGMMDRQRLEPARNAYNTFVTVPRALPRLAQRYLFDRSSFYEEPERYAEPER